MATTTYPAIKQTIPTYAGTALQGDIDHADWHDLTNKTVQAIEDVLGTTAGTSVLKNFTAGDFCAKTTDIPTVPVATGAEINMGTSTSVFATPKGISDSNIAFLSDIPAVQVDGWSPAGQTWTRESDNTFSEPIDATTKYQKGDKIKYKQGAGYKYQYIIGVGSYSDGKTIMTTTGGSDYIFTNGTAITDSYYSHVLNPTSFPGYLNWYVTHSRSGTAYTNLPTTNSAIFKVENTLVMGQIDFTMPATAGGSGFVYTSAPTTIVNEMSDIGIEVASSAQPFIISAGTASQILNYFNIYPIATIATTSGFRYVGSFRYGI